jgi:hypothetical protein
MYKNIPKDYGLNKKNQEKKTISSNYVVVEKKNPKKSSTDHGSMSVIACDRRFVDCSVNICFFL